MWERIVQGIANVNRAVNGVVWGVPFLILIMGTGILMTVRTGFFQVIRAKLVTSRTFLAIFRKGSVTTSKDHKAISQFQALSTALAATIGTGNIAGVATAVAIGGPGAVFWMWISAFFGMMTKYSEATLAVYYRKRNDQGEWSGGAMYCLDEGLKGRKVIGKLGRPLAILFALFCAIAAFGIGNMTQVNSIASSMESAFSIPPLATGIVLAIIAALVIIKGIKAIGSVAEKLVPFMALFYIVGSLIIFFMNFDQIPYVFSSIFKDAFNFRSVAGGVGGVVMMRAVTMGFKRGVFSNEAGLGSSAMAHASADVREPAQQGMWGIFEVFVDTIIVCTLTAFTILSATTGAMPVADALKNITTDVQYVQLADQDADVYAGRMVPLIDSEYNQVLSKSVKVSEGGTTQGKAYGKDVMLDNLTLAATGESDFIYTNVMTMQGIARKDASGNPVVDEAGNPVIEGVEFKAVEGVPLVTFAFSQRFGDMAGKLLSIAVLLFAFSTVLGWAFYGSKATEYLLGGKAALVYKVIFVGFIVVGATMSLGLAWDIADTLNGLMALPNLIGVLALSGVVVKITRNYIRRRVYGEPIEPILSAYPDIQAEQAAKLAAGED
ncbi:MAG: sodium:alanine symporter family protein [Clostridia bacterium]